MASSLSDEDFQTLQTQLINLKTINYTLEERNRKQLNEISHLQQKVDALDNENQKAQKTIAKSKKIKDVEQLLQENENLQLKLQSQEDEFSLQNSTLMEELSRLISRNEKLENEQRNDQQRGLEGNGGDSDQQQNEVRRLLAENVALKHNISDLQQKHERETARLKKSLHDLVTVYEPKNETAVHDDKTSAIQKTSKDDYDFVEVGEQEVSYRKSSTTSLPVVELLREMESRNGELETRVKELSEMQLLLDTERQEKRILQEELTAQQETLLNEQQKSEEEVARLSEKLKKKQHSLLQLQQEKEHMYDQNKRSMTELQQNKDSEIRQLQDLSQRLQIQLSNALQSVQDTREQAARTVEELESHMSTMRGELDGQAADTLRNLEADRIVLQSQLSDAKAASECLRNENLTLKEQVDTENAKVESLVGQLSITEERNSQLTTNLENLQKTADKRKALLDEMAMHLQTKSDDHQQEIAHLVDEYTQQIDSLRRKFEDEQARTVDLEKYKLRVEDLETEVQSLECTRGWFERRLNEAEESLQSTRDHYESTLAREGQKHEAVVKDLDARNEAAIKDLETQLEIANAEKAEFEDIIGKCKQEIKDSLEDRKIHDKKGASIIKDLKRQLQMERKRVESLQERFQELLNESDNNKSEIYKTAPDVDKTETSSISSWSMMSGGGASEHKESRDDGSLGVQNGSSPAPSSYVLEENDALVAKCVALQEGKYDLEERLSYLEETNAAMAEDIVQKAAIIQYYCMDKRTDPKYRAAVDKLTVKRVLDFIKDRGDENQRKVNRRLQRILEEYLTKNMYLQKDLDALSKENAVLRDAVGTNASSETIT